MTLCCSNIASTINSARFAWQLCSCHYHFVRVEKKHWNCFVVNMSIAFSMALLYQVTRKKVLFKVLLRNQNLFNINLKKLTEQNLKELKPIRALHFFLSPDFPSMEDQKFSALNLRAINNALLICGEKQSLLISA